MLGIHISEGTAEGWFGQGKPSAILSIVVLAVLILGTAFGVLAAMNFWGETNLNQPNAPATPVAPTPTTAGTIQVPDGPKIKVVFNGPPELKVEWEKVGMAGDGFQVQLIGTLKNVSNQVIKFSEIGFLFDGHQVDYIPGRTLGLGEIMKILKGFPGYTENTKVLEIKVKGFEIVDGSTTTPKPAVTEPATTKPTETETFNLSFTEEVLKNPQSPGEIEAAFWFLCSEKKYNEAAKLLTQEQLQFINSKGGLEWYGELLLKGRQLKRIEFWRVDVNADGNRASVDDATAYFTNGDKETYKGSNSLIKENGGWKKNS